MKKLMAAVLATLTLLAATFAFAQESEAKPATEAEVSAERMIKTIVPENKHTKNQSASVRMEFRPMYDDIRVYYNCDYETYQKDEAMTSVRDCLKDFMAEHQYYNYTYISPDREHYYKNEEGKALAEYMSFVRLKR